MPFSKHAVSVVYGARARLTTEIDWLARAVKNIKDAGSLAEARDQLRLVNSCMDTLVRTLHAPRETASEETGDEYNVSRLDSDGLPEEFDS